MGCNRMYSLLLHRKSFVDLHSFRVSLKLFKNAANSFSSASTDVSSLQGDNFTVSYLIDSLGFTTKQAESIVNSEGNPYSVLTLFRSHGFTDSQIVTIVTNYPKVLTLYAERSLAPKLQLLQSRGASVSELTETISKVPKILAKHRSLSVYYDLVKEVIKADKSSKFETLCLSSLPQGGKQFNKIRNISLLRDMGMPQQMLFPLFISNSPHICGKERFQESLEKVVEMGFDPTTPRFLEALRIVMGLSNESMQDKVSVYRRLGFSVEDIRAMFKKFPNCLALSEKKITHHFETMKKCGLLEDELCSVVKMFPQCIGFSEKNILNSVETFLGLGISRDEIAMMVKRLPSCIGYSVETVKKKTEFVVKNMGWPLKAVVLFPQVLGASMEKKIVPRCNVIKALITKGLIKSELPPLSSTLVCTDQVFLKRYVRKHDDDELVAELMAIFTERDKNKT